MSRGRKFKVNRIIKFLIYSDFLLIGGEGFVTPIVAVFVTRNIEGATIATVGFAVTIYWVVKSLAQLPIARFIDRYDGEEDDYWFMFSGALMYGLLFFAYCFISQIWQFYLVQGLLGLSMACAFPGYSALFTRHIDKHEEGMEWSLHSLAVGAGYAGAASLGGVIAERAGFPVVFALAASIIVLGALSLLLIRREFVKHEKCAENFKIPRINGRGRSS
ncbi:MAG: MFS transporter [bacterium]